MSFLGRQVDLCVLAGRLCVLAVGGTSPGWTAVPSPPEVAFRREMLVEDLVGVDTISLFGWGGGGNKHY